MARPIVLSKDRIVEYVLVDNREDSPEDQVVWELTAVPFEVRMEIVNQLAISTAAGEDQAAKMSLDKGSQYARATRWGLRGWSENYDLEPRWGSQRYGRKCLSDATLDHIPDDYIIELGEAIMGLSASDADAVGK